MPAQSKALDVTKPPKRPRFDGEYAELLTALVPSVCRVVWITYDEDRGELDRPEIIKHSDLIKRLYALMPTLCFKPSDLLVCFQQLREESLKTKTWACALQPNEYEEWEAISAARLAALLRDFQQSKLKKVKWALDLLGGEDTPLAGDGPREAAISQGRPVGLVPKRFRTKSASSDSVALPVPPAPTTPELLACLADATSTENTRAATSLPSYICGFSADQGMAWRREVGKSAISFTKDALS